MYEIYMEVAPNEKGRDLFTGDIHGHFGMLDNALKAVSFNPEKDRLFCVGDLVNKGKQNERALYYLDQPWFYATCGNHEQMLIDLYRGKIDEDFLSKRGGDWFINLNREEQELWVEKLKDLPVAIMIDRPRGKPSVGMLHSEVPPQLSSWNELVDNLENGKDEYFFHSVIQGRQRFNQGKRGVIEGVSHIFSGHTPVEDPIWMDNHFLIDTVNEHKVEPGKKARLMLFDIDGNKVIEFKKTIIEPPTEKKREKTINQEIYLTS